jgi:signal transduction histidine kinase
VESPVREATYDQQVTTVRDFRRRGLANAGYAPLHPFWRGAPWDDMTVVPLDTQGRSVGTLNVYLSAGRTLDEDDLGFLTAAADLAAVAVENARLVGQAEANAGLMERQRLARELHDSVSQALFSMTLHARAAERHLVAAGLDPDGAAAGEVARLRELTQGALAEMRALIFELRPGALAEEGLSAALAKQAAALSAREQVRVEVDAPSERVPLPPDVEEHVYRLALEALNNAVKHAQPRSLRIRISLTDGSRDLTVTVTDDGAGFDPAVSRPGHLGLRTMRERAAAVGGRLDVESAPGSGTRVTVTVPLAG